MTGDWKQRASEGITVFRASRLEALLEPLDHLLATQAPASPLAPQTVVAAHPGMRQWLAGALARQRGAASIVANLDIVLPSAFLDGLAREVLGEGAVSPRGWRREWLRWRVHELLDDPSDPALRQYLAGDDRALRRFQLADRLARIYIQYMAYRPDWLEDWGYSRPAFDGAGFHPALWRQLRQALGEPHRGERLLELRAALAGSAGVAAREPLHVFGLSHLAPTELQVLQALAVHRPVVFYLPDPCREYWAGLRSERARLRELAQAPHSEQATAYFLDQDHPLLAAWGRLGQHFMLGMQQLDAALDIRHFRDEREADRAPVSLLERTQESLRRLEPALMAQDERPRDVRLRDRSLRVHAAHSRLRELEVLRDALLRERAEHPGLEPSDIVVMAPDIGAYLPLLPAVFGEPGRAEGPLPYHLADVPMARAQPLFAAFRQLLALPNSRLTAPELVDFLGQPAVMRRLGLDDGALDTLTQWLATARAAWGLDPGFRAAMGVPATEEHTLSWAMDRLVAGFIHGSEDLDTVLHLPDATAMVPVPGVTGSAAPALGALDHLLQQVALLRADATSERTASDWARRLEERLDALFLADLSEPRESDAMDQLRGLLRALASEPGELGLDPSLAFPVVKQWLEERLAAVPERQRLLAGGITVCGMVPQRAIPFRVVAVLGLNEGEYPRSDVDAGLDPINRPGLRRLGDRDVRSDDRYLFLETLMSARDALHLSHVAFDAVAGSARNPAAPLAELIAALPPGDMIDDARVAPAWRVDHALQPFDRRYFDGSDPRLFCHRADFAGMVGGATAVPPLLPGVMPPPDVEVRTVSVAELRRYFRDPARVLLADRLQARLDALDESGLVEDEPLEPRMGRLDSPARALCLQALRDPASPLPQDAPDALRLAGLLPAAGLGAAAWRQEIDAVQALVGSARARASLAPLLAAGLPEATPALRRELGRFRITGELDNACAAGDAIWVLGLFPHRGREAELDLRDRVPLFLAWALARLAPENAGRALRLVALVTKPGTKWQDGIHTWDVDFLAASPGGQANMLADLEQRVLELLDLWARPVTHPAWYFPRASNVLATNKDDAEGAWQVERGFSPGYARLLGRGLDFDEGTPHFEALRAQAERIAEALRLGPEDSE